MLAMPPGRSGLVAHSGLHRAAALPLRPPTVHVSGTIVLQPPQGPSERRFQGPDDIRHRSSHGPAINCVSRCVSRGDLERLGSPKSLSVRGWGEVSCCTNRTYPIQFLPQTGPHPRHCLFSVSHLYWGVALPVPDWRLHYFSLSAMQAVWAHRFTFLPPDLGPWAVAGVYALNFLTGILIPSIVNLRHMKRLAAQKSVPAKEGASNPNSRYGSYE